MPVRLLCVVLLFAGCQAPTVETAPRAPVRTAADLPPTLLALVRDYAGRAEINVTFDAATNDALAAIPITRVGPVDLNTILIGPLRNVEGRADVLFEVVPLEHAAAGETANVLDDLVRNAAREAQVNVRVLSDERSNSLLICADARHRAHLKSLVALLDVAVSDG